MSVFGVQCVLKEFQKQDKWITNDRMIMNGLIFQHDSKHAANAGRANLEHISHQCVVSPCVFIHI